MYRGEKGDREEGERYIGVGEEREEEERYRCERGDRWDRIIVILLTAGTRSLLISLTALASFGSHLFLVSSTVIRTCSSSLKCSQFDLPRFCSS